jgi:hypothetical protein
LNARFRSPLLKCSIKHDHEPSDFVPISRFRLETLFSTIDEMKQILKNPSLSGEKESYKQNLGWSHNKLDTAYENEFCSIPSHATPIIASSELTQDEFTQLWKLHAPIVVSGVSPTDGSRWTPQYIAETYGSENCPIENCQTGEQKISTVREFFDMYGKGTSEPWKLKVNSGSA